MTLAEVVRPYLYPLDIINRLSHQAERESNDVYQLTTTARIEHQCWERTPNEIMSTFPRRLRIKS